MPSNIHQGEKQATGEGPRTTGEGSGAVAPAPAIAGASGGAADAPAPAGAEGTASVAAVAALRAISWCCASAALAIGASVLVGWGFDVAALRRVLPGLASMKANTAVGFVLVGAALLLRRREAGGGARAGLGFAGAALALGALTLFEYATGLDLRIDTALFADPSSRGHPGRMSMLSAANFTLLGAAVLFDATRAWRRGAEWSVLLVALSSMLALLGYAYGARGLYAGGSYSTMALLTALGFLCCALAVLLGRPGGGVASIMAADGPGGVLARRMIPAAVLLPAALGWVRLKGEQAGFYGTEFGLALFAASNIICFTSLTWLTASALSRADGAKRRAEAAARDRERALERSRARFARLFEAGVIGVAIANDRGVLYEANDAYLAMLGYSREDLAAGAIQVQRLTPPEWLDDDARARQEFLTTGVARPWEKEAFRKDGSRLPVLVGLASVSETDVLVFVVDLSERRHAEALKARLEAEARREGAGRERAEEAAHSELMLLDFAANDPAREDVEAIRAAGRRAADLTRQLLTFSRQQIVEPKVFDVSDLLVGMEKMLCRLVGEDVEMAFAPGAPGCKVRADPGSIEQVVMNLVVNARDAMPVGGKLTIETSVVELDEAYARAHLGAQQGPYVLVAVSDTGAGMDRATQARIFEPFFTTKGAGKGTGLGLSTVFGIVQQSGGSISVYSEPGRGSSFKVYLPLVEAPVDVPRSQATPGGTRGTETILLVEDENQVRQVARGILQRQGYRVLEAENAGEALLLCEQHAGPIDLLLSDVVMPLVSGPELARRLGRSRPGLKILCMSGYTDEAVIRHGALDPGIAFIQKPFTPESLARRVRDVLDAERIAPEG
ncbi:MAG: ATP-binding protein [Polyangiaceae bacterium]|nr:ATP-binding protein [Polyangiaceae bacterium]